MTTFRWCTCGISISIGYNFIWVKFMIFPGLIYDWSWSLFIVKPKAMTSTILKSFFSDTFLSPLSILLFSLRTVLTFWFSSYWFKYDKKIDIEFNTFDCVLTAFTRDSHRVDISSVVVFIATTQFRCLIVVSI